MGWNSISVRVTGVRFPCAFARTIRQYAHALRFPLFSAQLGKARTGRGPLCRPVFALNPPNSAPGFRLPRRQTNRPNDKCAARFSNLPTRRLSKCFPRFPTDFPGSTLLPSVCVCTCRECVGDGGRMGVLCRFVRICTYQRASFVEVVIRPRL